MKPAPSLQTAKTNQHRNHFFREIIKNRVLYLLFLPGVLFLLAFNYLPMFGIIVAFKEMNYRDGILGSPWIAFKNFEFLFSTPDAWQITRNTVIYNGVFISLGLIVSVGLAIALSEILSKRLAKAYQSILFLPYFLSWVVVSYIGYAFLSPELGLLNRSILEPLGLENINWYHEAKYWPYILTFFNLWKYTGWSVIVYLASITGIDPSYYEAAAIDGATRFQQIRKITIPMLIPMMTILTILSIGRIFSADFGLFFNVTLNSGIIQSTTSVIDTYVYNGLTRLGDVGMASAASVYQSVIGFILVLSTNFIVKKINPDNALF
ncbi:MAG: sugar ABC transporter permease [Gorillibacterium sp.]|nr:sugar ABC transporter permease [Gorillibacterium sp.]